MRKEFTYGKKPSERDWTEDSSYENGQYQCVCTFCKQVFIGHKRRIICKICYATPPAPGAEGE